MATRDLTTQYLRLRSAMHRKRGPEADMLGGASGAGAGGLAGQAGGPDGTGQDWSSNIAPVYVEMVNEISGDVRALEAKMAELRGAHEARVRITFDPAAEEAKEQEVQILTAELTRGFNLAGGKLKRLAAFEAGLDGTEMKVRKNMQRGLATRLHDLSTTFRRDQKQYIGTITKLRKGQSLQELFGSAPRGDVDEGFSDEQMHELAIAEEDVDERMREIQRIAKSVEDLAVLFKELATLIVEQGTILDRIDHNMETTVEATQKGVKELQDAEKFQKSARPIKCMLILMVLILIFVGIIIARKS